jgi:phage gp45-like
MYSAGVNIYSHSNNITSINTNQYIHLDKISSNEWVIDPADDTQIICMNSGAWQFIIKYDIDTSNNNNMDSSGSMVYGWITVNGIVETDSYSNKSFAIAGTNAFILVYYKALNQGDVIQFGIRTNNNMITCNSSSIVLNNSNTGANFSSNSILPTSISTNQYIQFNQNTYPFWINNPGNNTELICKLKSNWQFIVQYTLYNSFVADINNATVNGWIEMKNIDNNNFEAIDNSNNSITIYKKGSTTVLIYSIIQNFNLGDVIRFGIQSSNSNVKTRSVPNIFGTMSSSVIVSISSVISYSNIYTSTPKTNGMIILDSYDTSSWFINNSNMVVCMNSGTWQFFINYTLKNTNSNPAALLETSIKINDVIAPNFGSKLSVTENGEISILNVCFTRCFNLGDIIELDVSGNNITCTSVNISAIKLSNNVNTINTYSTATFNGDVNLVGENNKLGFFGKEPIERQSADGGDTLANIYKILRNYGLIL